MLNHFAKVDEHLTNELIQLVSRKQNKEIRNHELKDHLKDKYEHLPPILNKLALAGILVLHKHKSSTMHNDICLGPWGSWYVKP